MNKAILIGRLTRDPELRYTSSNRAVCQFTIAIDRPFTNQATGAREADFINVVAWDRTGENVGKFMTKGRLIAVEGRIQTRNYDDKDGKRVYVTEVLASNVQFLESKASTTNQTSGNYQPNNNYQQNSYQPQPIPEPSFNAAPVESVDLDNDPFASFGEAIAVSDNDLPF